MNDRKTNETLVFRSFMFHKVVQRHALGVVECPHSAVQQVSF